MAVKIVALDIYGTILASNDYENNFQVRNGLKQFFQHCENKDARVVSASDSLLARSDISELIKNRPWEDLGYLQKGFYDHYCLQSNPKEFRLIIRNENIKPSELLVIGDNYQKDIKGAKSINAKYIHVPEYKTTSKDPFDFSKIDLSKV